MQVQTGILSFSICSMLRAIACRPVKYNSDGKNEKQELLYNKKYILTRRPRQIVFYGIGKSLKTYNRDPKDDVNSAFGKPSHSFSTWGDETLRRANWNTEAGC